MILSVFSLGLFMVMIIFQYTGNDLMRSNVNLLDAMTNKIELILRDMESYNYNFSSNPTLIVRTKEIVSSEAYSYGAQQSNLFINNIINTPVNTNPYLYSVYIYYYNYNNLLCSGSGLVNINDFYDREWIESLKTPGFDTIFFRRREIMPHSFDREPTRVLTLNKPLYSPGASRSDGIITLNLNADYVEDMIRSLEVYKDQLLLILDSRGHLILSNVQNIDLSDDELRILREESYTACLLPWEERSICCIKRHLLYMALFPCPWFPLIQVTGLP
jgi:two-component system sensor histidine kinase YesM